MALHVKHYYSWKSNFSHLLCFCWSLIHLIEILTSRNIPCFIYLNHMHSSGGSHFRRNFPQKVFPYLSICLTCHLAACGQVPGLIVSVIFVHMEMTLTLASLHHGFLALFRKQGWKFEVGDLIKGR